MERERESKSRNNKERVPIIMLLVQPYMSKNEDNMIKEFYVKVLT